MRWVAFAEGKTLGEQGSEGGIILRDEEHPQGARITLEQGGHTAPFSITCGLYGWTAHTRFFASQQEGSAEMEAMKADLAVLLVNAERQDGEDPEAFRRRVGALIAEFVARYP